MCRTPKPVTRIVTTSWSGGPVLPMIADVWRMSSADALSCGGRFLVTRGFGNQCLVAIMELRDNGVQQRWAEEALNPNREGS